jgi:hypothetical protein
LKVSSSIHPIRRPTGTDDDMGGNDKADALGGTAGKARAGQGALCATSSQPGLFDRYWLFMTSPETECTCAEPEKRQVWPNRATTRASAQVLQGFRMQGAGRKGKVTRAPDLQSARWRISSANRKITVLF